MKSKRIPVVPHLVKGEKCPRCGGTESHSFRSRLGRQECKTCLKTYRLNWRAKLRATNPKKVKAQYRKWRKKNLDRRRQQSRDWFKRHPTYRHARDLSQQFGITLEQYKALLGGQNGVCAICKTPPTTERLAVDHCHETNVIRGLLCRHCNVGIGNLKDDPNLLRSAVMYLESRKAGWIGAGGK